MNPSKLILCIFAALIACAFLVSQRETIVTKGREVARVFFSGLDCLGQGEVLHLANIGEGTHDRPSLYTDAAIATRHLLFKIGSDATHIAVAGAADCPIGNVPDEASAAEELVEVKLLANGLPRLMIASEAIAADVDVFTAAAGKIQDEPATAGTFWKVGRTRAAAAADGSKVEVQPCTPIKLVVIAALTAPTTAAGSDAGTTQTLANAIKADLVAIDNALASPAILKII